MNNAKYFESSAVVYLKYWFFSKNFSGEYAEHFGLIIKQTEKAFQIVLTRGGGESDIKTWVPKSCTCTEDEFKAEIASAAEYEAQKQQRWVDACKAYKELVEYAQMMGVKGVREGLKKETILRKMEMAGVPLPA